MHISFCVDVVEVILCAIVGIILIVRRISRETFDRIRDLFVTSLFLATLIAIETIVIRVPLVEIVGDLLHRSYRVFLALFACVIVLRILFGTNLFRRGVTHVRHIKDVTEPTAQLVLMFGSTAILCLVMLLFSGI